MLYVNLKVDKLFSYVKFKQPSNFYTFLCEMYNTQLYYVLEF